MTYLERKRDKSISIMVMVYNSLCRLGIQMIKFPPFTLQHILRVTFFCVTLFTPTPRFDFPSFNTHTLYKRQKNCESSLFVTFPCLIFKNGVYIEDKEKKMCLRKWKPVSSLILMRVFLVRKLTELTIIIFSYCLIKTALSFFLSFFSDPACCVTGEQTKLLSLT